MFVFSNVRFLRSVVKISEIWASNFSGRITLKWFFGGYARTSVIKCTWSSPPEQPLSALNTLIFFSLFEKFRCIKSFPAFSTRNKINPPWAYVYTYGVVYLVVIMALCQICSGTNSYSHLTLCRRRNILDYSVKSRILVK